MRATEFVRDLLDLIDRFEQGHDAERYTQDDQDARFDQIADLLGPDTEPGCANAPDEQYAGVDSVTTLAGGGVNGPKHPDDIRVKDPRGYK